MFKRVTIVALVVAAFLVLAVPALAFNGFRADYTLTQACASCHTDGNFGAPIVYKDFTTTKHFSNVEGPSALEELPRGSTCAGCHSGNYSPAKVIPALVDVDPTDADGPEWVASNGMPTGTQRDGTSASSETFIGCSSCHYGASAGISPLDGQDVNDTAHSVPLGNMADAQICGACHSRYSYTKNTITVQPATTLPAPGPETTPVLIQPQMAIGYAMLGSPSPAPAWSPNLSQVLVVQSPGWKPSPNPAATTAAGLMTYWQLPGDTATSDPTSTMWQQKGHDGSAAQYPEWANEGHANALTVLTSQAFWGFMSESDKQTCLECHSADFRILKEAGKNPQSTDVKYGVTCVGCHAPHNGGTVTGVWDEAFDAQLNNDASLGGNASNVCTECHNGEIPEGTTASPGAEIHHPMKEMMDGYGAIDVSAFPSVHKGKCVQCHMAPTSISRGNVQLGGNHTFNIITPEVALEASPIAVATAVATSAPDPDNGGMITTTTKITKDSMPYSACSTCHANNNGVKATPLPTASATTAVDATHQKVTITQLANQSSWGNMSGGDRAIWLQNTIDQRQSWTKMMVGDGVATGPGGFVITGKVGDVLQTAAGNMGFANAQEAYDAFMAIPTNQWTTAQRAFLSSFTNAEFVTSEGSFGLHNWDYSREIVNTAMMQAKIAQTGVVVKLPWKVTLKLSKSSVKAGTKVKFTGAVTTADGVAGAGTVKIMKRIKGVWKVWNRDKLNASGKFSVTQKMTKRGNFYFRALMPGNSLNKTANSAKRHLVVK